MFRERPTERTVGIIEHVFVPTGGVTPSRTVPGTTRSHHSTGRYPPCPPAAKDFDKPQPAGVQVYSNHGSSVNVLPV